MTPALASLPLALQVYRPPDVQLPPGWRVDDAGKVGRGCGRILGPKGETILFPSVVDVFDDAATVHRRNPGALFVAAFMGGRPVEAALEGDGTLTVSFAERLPHEHDSDEEASYRTHVATAQELAQALTIVLTRLDDPARDPYAPQSGPRKPDRPAPPTNVPGLPPGIRVDLPPGFVAQGSPAGAGGPLSLRGPDGLTLALRRGRHVVVGSTPGRIDRLVGWFVGGPLLGGRLGVGYGNTHGLRAAFDATDGRDAHRSDVTVATWEATPRATLVAVFACLTYRPAP